MKGFFYLGFETWFKKKNPAKSGEIHLLII
jgi:hypothetical protein